MPTLLAVISLLILTVALGVWHLPELGISSWPDFLDPLMTATNNAIPLTISAFLCLMLLVISGMPQRVGLRNAIVLTADAIYLVTGNFPVTGSFTVRGLTIPFASYVGLLFTIIAAVILWRPLQDRPIPADARQKSIRTILDAAIAWAVICMSGLPPVILARSMVWNSAAGGSAQYGFGALYHHLIFTREWWVGTLLLLIATACYALIALTAINYANDMCDGSIMGYIIVCLLDGAESIDTRINKISGIAGEIIISLIEIIFCISLVAVVCFFNICGPILQLLAQILMR